MCIKGAMYTYAVRFITRVPIVDIDNSLRIEDYINFFLYCGSWYVQNPLIFRSLSFVGALQLRRSGKF